MDAHLRPNQLQLAGTAASYKQRPSGGALTIIRMGGREGEEALDFGEPSLAAQLDGGVWALGFDIANDPHGGAYANPAISNMAMELPDDDYLAAMKQRGFKTLHVIDVDYRSSCPALGQCLAQVVAWSHAHPAHLPIVITLRPNQVKTPMPGAMTPVAFDAAALDALDADIRGALGDAIITPDAVQGSQPSLRQAVTQTGWPKLGAARGKVRAMFVAADEASPLAAFVTVANAGEDGARIAAAVKAGFIVTTHADEDTREARLFDTTRRDAAFASGAQIVVSDFASADPPLSLTRFAEGQSSGTVRCGAEQRTLRALYRYAEDTYGGAALTALASAFQGPMSQ